MPQGKKWGTVLGVFLLLALILQFGCVVNREGKKPPEDPQNESPLLEITPMTLDFGKDKEELIFEISNGGGGELIWFMDESNSWGNVSCTPDAGIVTTGKETVKVTVVRTGLKQMICDQVCICYNGNGGGGCNVTIIVDIGGMVLLYGTVIDQETDGPLANVTITAGTPQNTTTSDSDGHYEVSVPVGCVLPIYAELNGYERYECPFTPKLMEGNPSYYSLDFEMTPAG